MRWNKSKSILLSKLCIVAFALAGIILMFLAPCAVKGVMLNREGEYINAEIYFLASFYTLTAPMFTALFFLYRLLCNISKGRVFVEENIRCMRMLSWACYGASFICVLSCLYYLPYLLIAVGAAFMGLILRIVKNVFAEAVNIKEENDFTI